MDTHSILFPSQFSEMETPLRTSRAKNTGIPFPPAPVQRPSLGEGQDTSISHPAPSYQLVRLSSGHMWLRHWGLILSPNPHSWDGGCTLVVASLSMLGPDHTYLHCDPCVIHTKRGKLRRPEATPLSISVQLLKQGVSLREKCSIVLPPALEPWLRGFPWRGSGP